MYKTTKPSKGKTKKLRLSTVFLYYTSIVIGSVILLLGGKLFILVYGHLPEFYSLLLMSLSFPWWIIASVVVIIRKEAPRPRSTSIKGGWAVFVGYIGAAVFGIAEIITLYILIREVLVK